jgi:hypothetical protein
VKRLAVLALAVIALGLAGCAGGMSKPDVTVRLEGSKLQLVPGSAKEGPVKFDVDNQEARNLELRIVRTDDPAKLAVTSDGILDVQKMSIADTLEEFTPGRFRFNSPNLPPGTYLMVGSTLVKGPDGKLVPHFDPQMVQKLTITKVSGD